MNIINKHFIDYINEYNKKPLHNLNKIYNELSDNIKDLPNLIFYGPPGIGKYTQMLLCIQRYSESSLKYQKKLVLEYNKDEYNFKISDIHYEIDMAILGCNSKNIWNSF